MRISRIIIKNFRNFKSLDVKLGEHAVVLGENKVGKTNLLFALRLILDPSLPDSARRLRLEDFWDGLERPLKKEDEIEMSVEFRDFEKSENLLAVLADHLVKPDPMVARITYFFRPIPGREEAARSEADYEFVIFGGNRPDNMSATIFGDGCRWTCSRPCATPSRTWRAGRARLTPVAGSRGAHDRPDELKKIAKEVHKTSSKMAA